MQRQRIGSGSPWFDWNVGERIGVRSLLAELETVVRRIGLHSGVRCAAVSSAWLMQYDSQNGKRGEDP